MVWQAAAMITQGLSSVISGLGQYEASKFNSAQYREQARFTEATGQQKRRAALRSYGEALASARAASAASGVAVRGDYDIFGEIGETYGRQIATLEVETEFEVSQKKAQSTATRRAGRGALVSGFLGGAAAGAGATALALGKD